MIKKMLEALTDTRHQVTALVNKIVEEALDIYPTYGEAKDAIRRARFELSGSVGSFIMEEAIEKINRIALEKPTK